MKDDSLSSQIPAVTSVTITESIPGVISDATKEYESLSAQKPAVILVASYGRQSIAFEKSQEEEKRCVLSKD